MQTSKHYVVCGDLNCPGPQTGIVDDNLEDIISTYNQIQLVPEPTHEAGNVLDLLTVPDTNLDTISNVTVHLLCFSDLVCCQLAAEQQQSAASIKYRYRPIKQIDISTRLDLKHIYLPLRTSVHCNRHTVVATPPKPHFSEYWTAFYKAIDSKQITVMISLGISASFDTINRSKLFFAVRDEFCVTDMALNWLKSFVRHWFADNDLLLNTDKSEAMFVGSSSKLKAALSINTVTVAGVSLPVSSA